MLFTGTPNVELQWPFSRESIVTPTSLAPPLLENLGLGDHEAIPVTPGCRALLVKALDLLGRIDASAKTVVDCYVSMVCWIRKRGGMKGAVSSTSFYELPHCVFLSDIGTMHVSPTHVFDRPTPYALADNIYHEALHQQLILAITATPVLKADSETTTILVPWRDTRWGLEQSIHALFVYAHLIKLRKAAVQSSCLSDEARTLTRASNDAERCRELLKQQLNEARSCLTEAGCELCDAL